MQCRDRHKSFVFNIRDVCFIMKMKNVKKIDMNKKLYEQIKALLADKLDEKEQKELDRNVWIADSRRSMFIYHIGYLWLP